MGWNKWVILYLENINANIWHEAVSVSAGPCPFDHNGLSLFETGLRMVIFLMAMEWLRLNWMEMDLVNRRRLISIYRNRDFQSSFQAKSGSLEWKSGHRDSLWWIVSWHCCINNIFFTAQMCVYKLEISSEISITFCLPTYSFTIKTSVFSLFLLLSCIIPPWERANEMPAHLRTRAAQ